MKISIVILAFNSAHFVTESVDSALRQVGDGSCSEVVVLDNGSSDDTYAVLRQNYHDVPNLTLLRVPVGLAFARGNNLAASYTSGDAILFLNDDCVLGDQVTTKLTSGFNGYPDVGVIGCALANPDGKTWDTLGHFLDTWGLLHPLGNGEARTTAPQDWFSLFGAPGAAFAIRRSLFESIGGFDSSFDFLFEETDLCWRALLRGWRVMGSGSIVAYHRHLARYALADSGLSHRPFYYETRNRLRAMLQNLSAVTAIYAIPLHVGLRLAYAAREALRGNGLAATSDVVRAVLDNASALPAIVGTRRQVQKTRIVSDRALRRAHLLVPPDPLSSVAWTGNTTAVMHP